MPKSIEDQILEAHAKQSGNSLEDQIFSAHKQTGMPSAGTGSALIDMPWGPHVDPFFKFKDLSSDAGPGEVLAKNVANYGSSAINLVGGIGELGKMATVGTLGAVDDFLRAAGVADDTAEAKYYRNIINGLPGFIKQRVLDYASGKAFFEDPVGVLGDLSMLAQGAGMAAKAGGIAEVGRTASELGGAANPFSMVMKGAERARPLLTKIAGGLTGEGAPAYDIQASLTGKGAEKMEAFRKGQAEGRNPTALYVYLKDLFGDASSQHNVDVADILTQRLQQAVASNPASPLAMATNGMLDPVTVKGILKQVSDMAEKAGLDRNSQGFQDLMDRVNAHVTANPNSPLGLAMRGNVDVESIKPVLEQISEAATELHDKTVTDFSENAKLALQNAATNTDVPTRRKTALRMALNNETSQPVVVSNVVTAMENLSKEASDVFQTSMRNMTQEKPVDLKAIKDWWDEELKARGIEVRVENTRPPFGPKNPNKATRRLYFKGEKGGPGSEIQISTDQQNAIKAVDDIIQAQKNTTVQSVHNLKKSVDNGPDLAWSKAGIPGSKPFLQSLLRQTYGKIRNELGAASSDYNSMMQTSENWIDLRNQARDAFSLRENSKDPLIVRKLQDIVDNPKAEIQQKIVDEIHKRSGIDIRHHVDALAMKADLEKAFDSGEKLLGVVEGSPPTDAQLKLIDKYLHPDYGILTPEEYKAVTSKYKGSKARLDALKSALEGKDTDAEASFKKVLDVMGKNGTEGAIAAVMDKVQRTYPEFNVIDYAAALEAQKRLTSIRDAVISNDFYFDPAVGQKAVTEFGDFLRNVIDDRSLNELHQTYGNDMNILQEIAKRAKGDSPEKALGAVLDKIQATSDQPVTQGFSGSAQQATGLPFLQPEQIQSGLVEQTKINVIRDALQNPNFKIDSDYGQKVVNDFGEYLKTTIPSDQLNSLMKSHKDVSNLFSSMKNMAEGRFLGKTGDTEASAGWMQRKNVFDNIADIVLDPTSEATRNTLVDYVRQKNPNFLEDMAGRKLSPVFLNSYLLRRASMMTALTAARGFGSGSLMSWSTVSFLALMMGATSPRILSEIGFGMMKAGQNIAPILPFLSAAGVVGNAARVLGASDSDAKKINNASPSTKSRLVQDFKKKQAAIDSMSTMAKQAQSATSLPFVGQ